MIWMGVETSGLTRGMIKVRVANVPLPWIVTFRNATLFVDEVSGVLPR